MHKKSSHSTLWLYGRHPCLSALQNPKRICHEVFLLASHEAKYRPNIARSVPIHIVDKITLEKKIPSDALHQGIALRVDPLPLVTLEDIAPGGVLVMLDQVTDPHNIGAILRSCAAFSASGVIVTNHHCPQESSVMAKSACGALEIVPLIRVANLDATIRTLQIKDYWCYGLTGKAGSSITSTTFSPKTLFIFGAEGTGLRDLTIKRCDHLIRLPISPKVESLNVSNAVAITLYEYCRSTNLLAVSS